MTLIFHPYDSAWVTSIRNGGPDANGQPAERSVSDGEGNPCRHCLDTVPKGAGMLICAARPFPELQPYAETGPIFLCADHCEAYSADSPPPVMFTSPEYLLKGYSSDYRIVYGTGQITPNGDIEQVCAALLARKNIAFVDVRSSRNNCFLLRVTKRNPAKAGY